MVKVGFKCTAITLAVAAVTCVQAQAAQVWYDGFSLTSEGGDYVVDAPLNGTSGGNDAGSGTPFFSGNWVAQDPGSVESLVLVNSTGLSRPGLTQPTVGGSARNEVDFGCCTFGRTSRFFTTPWGGFTDPDGTYYMGFLVNFGTGNGDVNDPNHRVVEMHFGGFDDTLNRNLLFGISNYSNVGIEVGLSVRDSVDDSSDVATLSEHADLNDVNVQGTHYVVLKFEMSTSTDDVISAFLDPVGNVEPTPSATVTVGQFLADRFSTLAQFSYNTGDSTAPGRFDELRVGTTFADVGINTLPFSAVPEPASLFLAGFGAVGLLLGRRRK